MSSEYYILNYMNNIIHKLKLASELDLYTSHNEKIIQSELIVTF
jgi:hypothetical protein